MIHDVFCLILLLIIYDLWWRPSRCAWSKCFWRRHVVLEAIDVEDIVDFHCLWQLQAEGYGGVLFHNRKGANKTGLELLGRPVSVSIDSDVFCIE